MFIRRKSETLGNLGKQSTTQPKSPTSTFELTFGEEMAVVNNYHLEITSGRSPSSCLLWPCPRLTKGNMATLDIGWKLVWIVPGSLIM